MESFLSKLSISYLYDEFSKLDADTSFLYQEWENRRNKYNLDKITEKILKQPERINEHLSLLENCWTSYMKGIQYMDILYPNITKKKLLYPKKVDTLHKFIKDFSNLNEIEYAIGAAEKNIAEGLAKKYSIDIREVKLPEESLPLSICKTAQKVFKKIKPSLISNREYVRMKVVEDEKLRNIYDKYALGSIDNFILFLHKLRDIEINVDYRSLTNKKLIDEETCSKSFRNSEITENIQKILLFDNKYETELRFTDIVKLDVPFYAKLSNILHTELTVKDILDGLESLKKEQETEFNYKIPFHHQNGPSCGASCLLNMLDALSPEGIPINKELENEIFQKVVVPGTINNLPTCLSSIAENKYGFPSTFIVNWKEYEKEFIQNPMFKNDSRVKKFLECKEKINTTDLKNLTENQILDYIKNGYMVSMVGEVSDVISDNEILHYRLIYGYEKDGKTGSHNLDIFDPLTGKKKISSENLSSITENRHGMWGLAVGSKDTPIISKIEEDYLPTVQNLCDKFEHFYSM